MLSNVLPAEIFAFLLITVRMASLIMVVPIFSEQSIPQRIRIGFGMMVAMVIFPTVSGDFPTMPVSPIGLAALFFKELAIGLLLGLSMRFLMSSLHTAGTVIAFQTGLSAAQAFDPSQGTQAVVVSAFFNLVATVLILATDLHHLMLRGMVYSYQKFPVAEPLMMADFTSIAVELVSAAFLLGFQMAAPFIVYGMLYNLSLGLVARLIQGFQVFFVGMPINLFMGFLLTSALLGSIMTMFLGRFRELLLAIMG